MQAVPASRVNREEGSVRIEGVPPLGWGMHKECTFAGSLEAAFAVTEQPYSYRDIMGLTGLAFRVRWYQGETGQRWCPSSPVGEFDQEIEAIQKATGWRFRLEMHMDQPEPHMERFAPDIKASIDAGLPVLAYEPNLNMALIYGYRDSGHTLLMRDYLHGDQPLELPAEKLGPFLIFLNGCSRPMPRRQAFIEALRTGAGNWRCGSVPGGAGCYWHGQAALYRWADDLTDIESLSAQEKELLYFVSWWNYDALDDARIAARDFLMENAILLEGEHRTALLAASDGYARESALIGSVFSRKNAFFGPWSGKSIQDWSEAVRRTESDILRKACRLEEEAIAAVEKAIS